MEETKGILDKLRQQPDGSIINRRHLRDLYKAAFHT